MPDLLSAVWTSLGGAADELTRLRITGPPAVLRSTFPVTAVGAAAVGASLLAATRGVPVAVDTRALGVALRSERHLRLDGRTVGSPFDPLSAFHRTSDGWLRLHANYPWHRAAALRVLDCTEDDVPAAIADRGALELESALHAAGGVGAAVRTEEVWRATAGPPPPLVERRVLGDAPPRPARRPRVLDLTRVIAGPVATRTLAAHGADVLRLDASDRPEIPLQAYDTLPGKRSALLDLATHGRVLEELLAGADVVVSGYRPGALDRFGLAPAELARRHPGLVVVTLSAWGHEGPWAHRRGFDSIVQAACGIAHAEGTGGVPGALPAQLLDHATGYLAAAGALLALGEQRRGGGTHHVRLALAGTAAWLQSLPRETPEAIPDIDPAPHLVDLAAPAGRLTLAAPPGAVAGTPLTWPAPAPSYGTAAARWFGTADR
ncbi:CoA transferase family III [Pseudonocardia hierapolitana]|uniref:CoA transferase family III n=1 Tax=Pseudonocardia hierapolitana TaxID=1128676 RepID=A0A561SHN3_9PSEU|nr:CoA transferase [Pseudonocardia hierapolitana]TWF74381.1 CoA transferase family III [Pseudonocardia hierapolitana]